MAFTAMELYMLKRLSDSAPYVRVSVTNWLRGAISPFDIRTKVLPSEASSRRYCGSDWIITLYTFEKRLKLDTYCPP